MNVEDDIYQQTNGGGSTVAGWSLAIVTAATVGILLRRHWWSDESGNQKSTATAVDSKQVSSDQQTANSGRSTSLEIEIDEQKKQIWQLMTRERDMKHYIQMLQQQLEKRSSEAVVSAARLREVESNIQPSETPEPPAPPPPLQPQQLEDEPLYKRRIRVIYDKLSQKIDAGIIGKHLYQQGALNNKEKEEIQRLSNRPTAAAEQLLDIVLSQTEDFYDCFLDSLSKTDQIDVRQWIILQGCNPDVECTEWIREHYVFLLDSLDSVISGLINYLYQFKVFDQAEADDVRTQRTSAKQNERLLSILGRKSLDKIKLFFAALDMTGQGHIRKEIDSVAENDRPEDEQHIVFLSELEQSKDELQHQQVKKLVQKLAEPGPCAQQLNDRSSALVPCIDELEHRLAESRGQEQDLAAWILELAKSKNELEEKLAESSRREQELNDYYCELVKSKVELEQRLANFEVQEQARIVELAQCTDEVDDELVERELAQSNVHLEHRMAKAGGSEQELNHRQRQLVESKNEFESEQTWWQSELPVVQKYRNSAMSVVKTLSGAGWVVGLTCLDDELFVLHQREDNQVEVYSTKTSYVLLRRFSVNGLGKHRHNDMASCERRRCLYISDCSNRCVHKSTPNGDVIAMWPVPDSSTGLSLTLNNNLLFTCRESRRLLELSSESGECVRQVDLKSDIEEPRFALQLSSELYVISHCGVNLHRVCVVDAHSDSQVSLSYGRQPGGDVTQFTFPTHVVVDRDDFLFVGDWGNHRVALLSPRLHLVRCINFKDQQPGRLYLDHVTRRLYVGFVNGDVTIVQM